MPSGLRYGRWIWLLLALLLVFWLGANGLDADPIWNDEWYMIRDARVSNDPGVIFDHLATQNPWHVPGYYITLNLWGRLTDWHPFTLRALSLFIGLLGVVWTYRLGRRVSSEQVGIYAALVVGSSAFLVHYLAETRMYTLTVALTAFAVWFYLRLISPRRPPRWPDYVLLFLTVAVMLYTHYFLMLVLGALALAHLVFVSKTRRWWAITITVGLAALLYIPWIGALERVVNRASGREVVGLLSGPETLAWISVLFSNAQVGLLALIGLLALVPLIRRGWRAPRRLTLLWFMVVVIAVEIVVVSLVVRVFVDERARYLIFVWPLLAVLIGVGIAQLPRLLQRVPAVAQLAPVALLALWVGIGTWNTLRPTFVAELPGSTLTYPLHVVMRTLDDLHRPGDYILNVAPDSNDWQRYGNNLEFYVHLEGLAADSRVIGQVADPAERDELLQSTLTTIGPGREYVWVAYRTDLVSSPVDEYETAIGETYAQCGAAVERADWALRIDEYAPSPVCCTPETGLRTPEVRYGNGLDLVGVDTRLNSETGLLSVYAAWVGANDVPANTYSVALQVLDADSGLVAQSDGGLPVEAFRCERKDIDLSTLPAGDYTLAVIVYNWQTGERLTGTVTASGEASDVYSATTLTLPD